MLAPVDEPQHLVPVREREEVAARIRKPGLGEVQLVGVDVFEESPRDLCVNLILNG